MTKQAPSKEEAQAQATRRLEDVLSRDPVLCGAEVSEVLRVVAGNRAIFAGEFAGQSVVFRFLMHDGGPAQAAKEWREMVRANAYMNQGPLRSVLPLAQIVDEGLIVMERETGRPLLEYLRSLQARALRVDLINRAAGWLSTYCAPTLKPMAPNIDRWLRRASESSATQPFAHLRGLEQGIFEQMQRIGDKMQNMTWQRAISHGDFHLNNLFHQDGVLTGFDLGGSGRLPIYKDRARALTHMSRRGMVPSRRRCLGMDAAAFEAFSTGLDPSEADLALPFFLGFETLVRVEGSSLPERRIKLAERMASGLLDDLKQV